MNVYGRVREESLAQTVEKVAGRVLSEEKYVPSMYRQAVGAEPENATAIDNKQLRLKSGGGAEVPRNILVNHWGAVCLGLYGERNTPKDTPWHPLSHLQQLPPRDPFGLPF